MIVSQLRLSPSNIRNHIAWHNLRVILRKVKEVTIKKKRRERNLKVMLLQMLVVLKKIKRKQLTDTVGDIGTLNQIQIRKKL